MVENEVPIVPLDTSKWEEPIIDFFGVVRKSEYRTTDDAKGKDGRTFTETRGLPRPGRTWHVEIERLDAIYDLPDGATAPVTVYMTVDLERLSNGRMVPVPYGDNKPTFTVDKWNEAGLRLAPTPGAVIGKKAQFRLERTHKFGSMVAKDIVYPTKLLPDGYEFTGEVSRFQVRERTSLEQAAEAVEASTAPIEVVDIPALLVGVESTDEGIQAFVKAHPDLPGDVKVALLTEDLVGQYIADGTLVVKDGLLALA